MASMTKHVGTALCQLWKLLIFLWKRSKLIKRKLLSNTYSHKVHLIKSKDEPSEKRNSLLPFTGFGFRVTLQGAMLSSSVAASCVLPWSCVVYNVGCLSNSLLSFIVIGVRVYGVTLCSWHFSPSTYYSLSCWGRKTRRRRSHRWTYYACCCIVYSPKSGREDPGIHF